MQVSFNPKASYLAFNDQKISPLSQIVLIYFEHTVKATDAKSIVAVDINLAIIHPS